MKEGGEGKGRRIGWGGIGVGRKGRKVQGAFGMDSVLTK